MENFNIRNVELKDYEKINQWWELSQYKKPTMSLLPNNGLGGLIIEKEKPIAVAYIYMTNSKIAYIDFLVSDPTYREEDRYDIIMLLISASIDHACELGCDKVWAMSNVDGIINRSKELGCDITKQNYAIITHN